MAQPEILTIQGAAAALNVSEPRIHQLLAAGKLDGPELPAGRQRYPRGAGRVTRASIDTYREAVATSVRGKREGRSRQRDAAEVAAPEIMRPPAGDAAAAQAAAQELKVQMDTLRDEIRRERARSRTLLTITNTLASLLGDALGSADRLDDVAEGYSQALTQLLANDADLTY